MIASATVFHTYTSNSIDEYFWQTELVIVNGEKILGLDGGLTIKIWGLFLHLVIIKSVLFSIRYRVNV
jgi:hypothetical protein